MPQAFSTADMQAIARLARLELTADELALFAPQLEAILRYVEQIQSVDTRDVPATAHAAALSAPLRDDEGQPPLPREEALAGAPATDDSVHLFKVPRVLG